MPRCPACKVGAQDAARAKGGGAGVVEGGIALAALQWATCVQRGPTPATHLPRWGGQSLIVLKTSRTAPPSLPRAEAKAWIHHGGEKQAGGEQPASETAAGEKLAAEVQQAGEQEAAAVPDISADKASAREWIDAYKARQQSNTLA